MRIVVFGAGGFSGGWICEELAQHPDVELTACVRKWASAVRIARRGIPIRRLDLEDVKEIPSVLAGADVVVNASMPPPDREPDLARALYCAALRGSVRRFIQFSSAAVYGNLTGKIDENSPPSPIDDYSRGKAETEQRLIKAAANSSTQLFILRPSIIYGPFSEAWTIRYVQRIVSGRWREIGPPGEGTCNLVHAHDVAKAVMAAATADVPPGVHIFNINGPDAVTWNEYIERLGDALGTPGRSVPNTAVFRGMALAAEVMRIGAKIATVKKVYRKSTGSTRAAMVSAQGVTKLYPTRGELELLGRKVHYPASLAERILNFRPSISLTDGLRQSAAWCRMHGVV